MQKYVRAICLFLGMLSFAHSALFAQPPTRRKLTLTYTCTLANLPTNAKEVNLWIPLLSSNDRQKVRLLTTDLQGGRITIDKKYKNQMLYRHVTSPLTALNEGKLTTALTYEAEIWETSVSAAKTLPATKQVKPGKAYQVYLSDSKLIPIHGPITVIANKVDIPKGEPLRAGRKIYDYLIDTMVYNYQAAGAGIGDAVWACDSKTGDCSDYHSVFIGVCRSQGIPADHVFGLPLNPDKTSGQIADFHCWARFWVAGIGWVPIDASEADKHPEQRDYLFGSLSTRCIQLSHGRDVILDPPQKGEPLNMFVAPIVEVDGKPFAGITWNCTYHPVEAR